MSLSSTVSLGALRIQAQQRADLDGSPAISNPEWNQYISQSYKELYDLLVAAYGNDYFVAALYQFSLTSSQYYSLPSSFYKLLGVDLQYSASPSGFVTLRRFEEIDRNRYAYPNSNINTLGYSNLRYRISGSNIEFIPIPMAGQTVQLKYIPEPTSLQYMLACATTISSTTVSMSDVSGLSVGMSVYGTGIPTGVTVSSINTTLNTIVISSAATVTQAVITLTFWIDSTTIDGISGWEEYVIIDAAIKAKIKQEEDVSELRVQKAEMKVRIEGLSEGRDAGQAHHVSDALAANGGYDGGGFGYDGF